MLHAVVAQLFCGSGTTAGGVVGLSFHWSMVSGAGRALMPSP